MALDCDPESLRFRRKFDGYLKPARPGTEISAFGRMMATKTLAARARHIERDLGRALKEREQVRKRSRAARVRGRLMVCRAGGDEEARDAAGRDEAPWGADHDEGVRSWRATVVSMFLELPATANARILGEAE